MTKKLTLDEILWALQEIGRPSFHKHKAIIEAVANLMATELAAALDVVCGEASAEEPEFAGTCVPFYARHVGQACPEALIARDATQWTTEDGVELDPKTGAEV